MPEDEGLRFYFADRELGSRFVELCGVPVADHTSFGVTELPFSGRGVGVDFMRLRKNVAMEVVSISGKRGNVMELSISDYSVLEDQLPELAGGLGELGWDRQQGVVRIEASWDAGQGFLMSVGFDSDEGGFVVPYGPEKSAVAQATVRQCMELVGQWTPLLAQVADNLQQQLDEIQLQLSGAVLGFGQNWQPEAGDRLLAEMAEGIGLGEVNERAEKERLVEEQRRQKVKEFIEKSFERFKELRILEIMDMWAQWFGTEMKLELLMDDGYSGKVRCRREVYGQYGDEVLRSMAEFLLERSRKFDESLSRIYLGVGVQITEQHFLRCRIDAAQNTTFDLDDVGDEFQFHSSQEWPPAEAPFTKKSLRELVAFLRGRFRRGEKVVSEGRDREEESRRRAHEAMEVFARDELDAQGLEEFNQGILEFLRRKDLWGSPEGRKE